VKKIALVTGGQGGIGCAIDRRLSEEGYTVVSADITVDAADNGKRRDDMAGEVVVQYLDVTDQASCEAAVAAAAGLGTLTAVVNCAGILVASSVDEWDEERVKRMFDINVFGMARVTSAAARHMNEGGAIVNISSVSCRISYVEFMSLYGATKASMESYTRNCATDLASRNIRVNSIAPGIIDVDMSDDMRRLADAEHGPVKRIPMGRMGTAEEIADAIEFLLSDRASYITGTNLLVDGGLCNY
jgi:3-oxoacyl-[acyl-carrier protein] reductase